MTSALLLFARGAVILGFALVAVRLLQRSPATLRYLVLAAALTAALALPLIEGAIPTWHTGALATEAVAAPIHAELPLPDLGGAPTASPVIITPPDVELPWTSILGGLWLLGLSIAALRVGYGAARARLIAHRGSPSRPGVDVTEVWRSLGGSGKAPRIVSSSEVEGPIVVGALAPIVVVPRAASGWSADRWRIVLLHELAHVRQRDGLINLVAQLACCLHWIDPLAWIAARRLREERELAADDAVLRAGARASSYAEHLVELATGQQSSSVLAMAERSRFESRVVALLDVDRPRRTGWHRAVAVIAASAVVTVGVACVSPDSSPISTEPSPSAPTQQVTTTDPALQTFLEQQLETAIQAHRGTGAVAIVLDAKTGKPVAIASRGQVDARTPRIPGSTVKPFAFAAALEAGTVDATTKVDCENGVKTYGTHTVRDSSPNGTLDLGGILAVSSNVCTAKLVEPLGDQLGQSFRRYRLSAPEHVDTRSFEGAAVAFGEGVAVSPLELASAYTALAEGGIHHAVNGDGIRVMREDTAHTVLGLMERVVVDSCGTGQAARLDGVRVAGKTGTARSKPGSERNYASFVGIVPADHPRFVILVGVDGVTSAGGKVAAPVFTAIATRVLR